MLSTASVTTMLPVKDIDHARALYEGCLGLAPGGFKPDGKFVCSAGGSTLALFPNPDGTKADHSAIRFRVSDIAASIEALKRWGVVFEDHDFPGAENGESRLHAWRREGRLVQGDRRQLPLPARRSAGVAEPQANGRGSDSSQVGAGVPAFSGSPATRTPSTPQSPSAPRTR